jgi:hypothetical protein
MALSSVGKLQGAARLVAHLLNEASNHLRNGPEEMPRNRHKAPIGLR